LGSFEQAMNISNNDAASNLRIIWIDWAKCAALFFILYHHQHHALYMPVRGVEYTFGVTIFTNPFNVPVFLFISGFLTKAASILEPARVQVAKIARTILLPYFAFYLIDLAIVVITKLIVGDDRPLDYKAIFLGMLDGSQWPHNHFGSFMLFGYLWFLWALAWCKAAGIALSALYRKGGDAKSTVYFCAGLIFFIIVGWLVNKSGAHLPFSLNAGLLAIPIYGVGLLMRLQNIHIPAVLKEKSIFIPALILLLAGVIIIPIYNAPEDLWSGNYGRTGYWLFALHIFCGVALICLLCARIKLQPPRLALLWSNGCLAIWALSNAMNALLITYWPFFVEPHPQYLTILFSLAQLALLTPFAWLVLRFAPWLIGKQNAKKY
jgi:fucose 4-O-acetylase-like acetyltransferase